MKPKYYAISFSGGKDSTALTLEWLKRHKADPVTYPLHEVCYCDTWKEFPAMIEHIAAIEKIVTDAGIKFARIQSDKSFDYYMFDHKPNRKPNHKLYGRDDLVGYGWAGPLTRWCTRTLKLEVINRHFRQIEKEYDVIHLVGLAADETERLARKSNQKENVRHPLAEWGWTESDCLQYCKNLGYTWGGLYDIFSRVSCWCCPLQSLDDLRNLRKHFPDLWKEMIDMDSRTWRVFSQYHTVADLEKRFALEDKYVQEGRSIRSRDFYDEYRRIAPPDNSQDGVIKREYR